MTVCKNCEYHFEGKFCPNCAQKASTHRFTIGHLAHELFHAVTHTDKGILFLIKELFYRPGKVAKEYNAGKRKKYFNPVTFLLIGMAFQIFASQKTNYFIHFNNSIKNSVQQISEAPFTTEESKKFDMEMERLNAHMAKVMENTKVITFLLIPVLSLLTWLFFWKTGNNYAENLVMNILIQGQMMVYFLVACIVPFLISPSTVMLTLILYYLILIVYSIIAYKQFYNQGWGRTIWKVLAIQILYMVIVQQFTTLIIQFV
jgi:ABC-type multidrug transport system fused ATPase/permease subunit